MIAIAETTDRFQTKLLLGFSETRTRPWVVHIRADVDILWAYASEEEGADLMRMLVKEVQVQKKDSVKLYINAMVNFSEFQVRNNSRFGSGGRI